jgi:hypothetical protein
MLGLVKRPTTTKILCWNEGRRSVESKLKRIWIVDVNHIFVGDRKLVNISDVSRGSMMIKVMRKNDNC